MLAVLDKEVCPQSSAQISLVKWHQPAEELIGMVRITQELIERTGCGASGVRMFVPSDNWAAQLKRVCDQLGLPAVFVTPHARISRKAQQSLALLRLLAQPENASLRDAAISLGIDETQMDACVSNYRSARSFTLVRALGLHKQTEFEHALSQTQGDEDAAQLLALIEAQMKAPTFSPSSSEVPIVHLMRKTELTQRPTDYVFLLACVDGLLPACAPDAASTSDTPDASDKGRAATTAAFAEAQAAFSKAISCAKKQVFISYFDRIEESVAKAAHISFARSKHEDGVRVAMTHPTPFLSAWGTLRPSTESGQALLRSYGLN